MTDWSLTSLNTLIVTDWDNTNWEGDPEMTPVDGFRDRPLGSDPEVMKNDNPSPVIEGVAENRLFFERTYDDWGYENNEMDWRTVNERENDWSLTSLNALIVTDWDRMNRDGVPDMIPVEGLRDNPSGRDPDMIENERSSPLIVGETENDSPADRIYEVWG